MIEIFYSPPREASHPLEAKVNISSEPKKLLILSGTEPARIVQTPGIGEGRPRIAGRRIRVQDVVTWFLQNGMTAEEIASEFDLEIRDILAALAYYYAHKQAIDADIRADRELVNKMKRQLSADDK